MTTSAILTLSLLALLTAPTALAGPVNTYPVLASTDCLPWIETSGTRPHVVCDQSGQACGISQQPICWTVRFTCMNALIIVLRLYDEASPQRALPSSCEGQPGW